MQFPLTIQKIALSQILLPLFVPDSSAVRQAYKQGSIAFPYWSQIWPAAIGLAEFILAHPQYTAQKQVVELGAGLGLPSLVAARNAAKVLCTDYIAEAVAIAEKSAAHLGLHNFAVKALDWHHLPPSLTADVLLLSDINYDPEVFSTLQCIIVSFIQKGTTVLISTPQRLMAKEFISNLLSDCVEQKEIPVKENGKSIPITLFVLKRNI